MRIWTDRKGRVHSAGRGDMKRQIEEIDKIVTYLYYRQTEMSELCEKIAESAATIPVADRLRAEAKKGRKTA